jgi:hypothetical protein
VLAGSVDARILVQYVPHAFGWKAMNVPFCMWLRSRRERAIWVMFHEVQFPVTARQSLNRNALGLVTRGMAGLVGSAATRAFISTSAWEPLVRSVLHEGTALVPLPVPSVVERVDDESGVMAIRDRWPAGTALVGHVGGGGELIRPLLTASLRPLLRTSRSHVLLMGRGADPFAEGLVAEDSEFRGRVHGFGEMDPADLSRHVSACDLLLQPYPDGVTTRRTSTMIGLAHGRPVVTTTGALTEQVWQAVPGVTLVPVGDSESLGREAAALADNAGYAMRVGAEARQYYDEHFDVRHTIAMLREDAPPGDCLAPRESSDPVPALFDERRPVA